MTWASVPLVKLWFGARRGGAALWREKACDCASYAPFGQQTTSGRRDGCVMGCGVGHMSWMMVAWSISWKIAGAVSVAEIAQVISSVGPGYPALNFFPVILSMFIAQHHKDGLNVSMIYPFLGSNLLA